MQSELVLSIEPMPLISKAHYERDGTNALRTFTYPKGGLGNLALPKYGWNEQTNFGSGRVSGTEAEFRTGSGSGNYDA